jgi:hypothetical protein
MEEVALFATKSGKKAGGWAKWASPVQILHSRQGRPLFQDDRLMCGDLTPRGLIYPLPLICADDR